MRIAIFDYKVLPNNPIGSCHRRLLEGLCDEHEFVVFAVKFDNPRPDRIRFVRVPVPTRPLALLFVAYHLLAPVCYLLYRLRGGGRFDLMQSVESNCLLRADIDYAHFCHRRFLKEHWPALKGKGLRSFLRFWDHKLHAMIEPLVYRRSRSVVVPSRGLQRELMAEYPVVSEKLAVLANPVAIGQMTNAADFDRAAMRRSLDLADNDVGIVFMALGHFERKGLPLLLEAMARLKNPSLRLVVVGGESDLIRSYRARIAAIGLVERQVSFVGMQKDGRPYLWACDAFALPSAYEVFPLVVLEAAAAGVPIIVSPLNGVEEFVRDGVNGIVIERSAAGMQVGLERFLSMSRTQRDAMARQAQQDVRRYSVDEFHANWRKIYQSHQGEPGMAAHRASDGYRL